MNRHRAELEARGIVGAEARWAVSGTGWEYWGLDRDGGKRRIRGKRLRVEANKGRFWWGRDRGYKGALYYFEPANFLDAVVASGGRVWLLNGEAAVETAFELGMWNAFCWFGEGSVPATLIDDLRHWGVKRVMQIVDNDRSGLKAAAEVASRFVGTGLRYEALSLTGRVGDGGDLNDLWIGAGFDGVRCRREIHNLEIISQAELDRYKKPEKEEWDGQVETAQGLVAELAQALGVTGMRRNARDWGVKAFFMPYQIREERNQASPSGNFNFKSGVLYDRGHDVSYGPYKLAKLLGIDISRYQNRKKGEHKRERTGVDATTKADLPRIERIDLPSPQDAPAGCFEMPHAIGDWQFCADIPVEVWQSKHIALRARKGTGKTWSIRKRFEEMDGKRLAVFAYTQQARHFAAQTRDCMCYDDLSGADVAILRSADVVATTLKSLPKLVGEGTYYDLVFVDEANEVIRQLHSGIYRKAGAQRSYDALRGVLAMAGQTILAGADLSDLEIEFHSQAVGARVKLVENTRVADLPVAREWSNSLAMIDEAVGKACVGKSVVFIACGSKARAREIALLCEKRGIKRGEIALVTSETVNMPAIDKLVREPGAVLPGKKALIYTYAIGSGFSYDGPCAGLYCLDVNRAMTPMQVAQMMNRARHADSYHYATFYGVSAGRELEPSVIFRNHLDRYEEDGGRVELRYRDYDFWLGASADAPEFIRFLWWYARYQARSNKSRVHRAELLRGLLVDQGHRKCELVDRTVSDMKEVMSELRRRVREMDCAGVMGNAPVDRKQYESLCSNRMLTVEVSYGRQRDEIESCGQYISEDLFERFGSGSRRRYLRNLNYAMGDAILSWEGDRAEENNRLPLHRRGHWQQRRQFFGDVVGALSGLRGFESGLRSLTGQMLSAEEVARRLAPVMARWVGWQTLFRGDERPDYSEKAHKVAGRVLKRLGVKWMARKSSEAVAWKVNDKGKRIAVRPYLYYLDGDSLEAALRDIKYLRVHLATLGQAENPLEAARLVEERARGRREDYNLIRQKAVAAFERAFAAAASVLSNDGLFLLEADAGEKEVDTGAWWGGRQVDLRDGIPF